MVQWVRLWVLVPYVTCATRDHNTHNTVENLLGGVVGAAVGGRVGHLRGKGDIWEVRTVHVVEPRI